MTHKICNIVGARPQFIKYCPIHRQIETSDKLELQDYLIHTGQHYDHAMSDIFFEELGFRQPDYYLDVGSGSHGEQTAEILKKTEAILLELKPDLVVVYGDTNSTLAGALAAAKQHIPVAHIEAGLRSFNKAMPEEINRIVTDHMSTLLFCPSPISVANLQQEGFSNIAQASELLTPDTLPPQIERIDRDHPLVANVGDIMYEVMMTISRVAESKSDILSQLALDRQPYNLLTIHRAENTDSVETFQGVIDFVDGVAGDTPTIFPAHPRTQNLLKDKKITLPAGLNVIAPLGYLDLLKLLKHSDRLLTDSGGMQKEAYWLKVPCITLRNETEWRETVETGWNTLYKTYTGEQKTPAGHPDIYGDGRSAETILRIIQFYLDGRT